MVGWLFPPVPFADRKFLPKLAPAVFLLIPLVLCVLCTAFSIILILKSNPLAFLMLMSQNGNYLTSGGDASLELHGTVNISVLFVSGVVWWSVWRSNQFGVAWRGKSLGEVCSIAGSSSSAHLHQPDSVQALGDRSHHRIGALLFISIRKTLLKGLNWKVAGRTALVLAITGSLVFFFVSFLKGASDPETQISTFLGYTIASYNRLAALLHGQLHFEYSGRGIYFSSFLSFNNLINQFIPFRKVLDLPDFYNWWLSEFDSVGRAGLNSSLIFFGTFGEIFAEIGWFAPLYVFFYGLLYGLVWRWAITGRLIGIVLYPYCAYCILFWFSTNGLFDQDIFALIIDAMLLATYEFLFLRPAKVLQAPFAQIA